MMVRKIFIVLGLVALLPTMSCKEEEDFSGLIEDENRYFDLYMQANYPDLQPEVSGLYYIEAEEGSGASPDTGDYILINYLAYTIPDETVVDTYTEEWAVDYGLYNSDVLYGPYKYKHGTEIPGMLEGISRMKEGGISRLIFKSDLGYGADGYGVIGKFSSLMYDIELVEIIGDDPASREKEQIDAFLAEHITAQSITDPETGVRMYYIPKVVGDSIQVAEGNNIQVFYTGQLLDGRVFDSNIGGKGLQVVVGDGDVIRGWDLGLKYFRYGGTGQLLIPHELAYGEDGSTTGTTLKTSIPPFEALLFDIEVTKFVLDDNKD